LPVSLSTAPSNATRYADDDPTPAPIGASSATVICTPPLIPNSRSTAWDTPSLSSAMDGACSPWNERSSTVSFQGAVAMETITYRWIARPTA
jgi:hypothetical protein